MAEEKLKIKETIVVEGKDDISAVLAAVDANIICTSGWGLRKETIDSIRCAYEGPGIIIFTDPDYAGRKIRERLTKLFPNAKQAFLTASEAEKSGDIGVENALPSDIIKALKNARAAAFKAESQNRISSDVLIRLGLIGDKESAARREGVGHILGIGYANAKMFAKRLEYMNISTDKLEEACNQYSNE